MSVRLVRRAVCGLLVLTAAVFVASTLPGVRNRSGFDPAFDGWVQGGAYVLTFLAAATVVTARARPRQLRLVWILVAAALALRAAAFVVYLVVVRREVPLPYPSIADLLWLLMYLPLLAALGVLARAHTRRLSRTLLLDGLLGGLTAAAGSVALLYGTLVHLTRAGTPRDAIATNLAYPVLDIALLVVVAGVLLGFGWRPSPAVALLAAGVVAFAVGDTVFLYQVSAGTYRPGSALAALSLIATTAMGLAGAADDTPPRRPRSDVLPGLAVPIVAAVVCGAALVYSALVDQDTVVTSSLASGGLVLAVVRGLLTVIEDRGEATAVIAGKDAELLRFRALAEASTDFIAMARSDGAIVYVNPAGRRLVGLDADSDISSTHVDDLLVEDARGGWDEWRRPWIEQHGHWEGESTLQHQRGGAPIPVAVSSFLMRGSDDDEPVFGSIQRDISDRIRAERELRDLVDQRQVLLDRLVQAQEDERSAIAADVHDDSVQALAAVDLRLLVLRRRLSEHPELAATVDELSAAVGSAMVRLRHLLFDLESPALEDDLGSAVTDAASYALSNLGIDWRVRVDDGIELDKGARVTVYRVAKEALVNIAKHANAHRVEIVITSGAEGCALLVTDDGVGFDPAAVPARPGHLGLSSMGDRAAVAGGSLEVDSAPGRGTRVRLQLPPPRMD